MDKQKPVKNRGKQTPQYTIIEEIANSITHGIGAGLADPEQFVV